MKTSKLNIRIDPALKAHASAFAEQKDDRLARVIARYLAEWSGFNPTKK